MSKEADLYLLFPGKLKGLINNTEVNLRKTRLEKTLRVHLVNVTQGRANYITPNICLKCS